MMRREHQGDTVAIFSLIHEMGRDHNRNAFLDEAVDVGPELAAGDGSRPKSFIEKRMSARA